MALGACLALPLAAAEMPPDDVGTVHDADSQKPRSGGSILFHVTNLEGKPILGASVWLDRSGRNVGVTDSLGRYSYSVRWTEHKKVLVRADGHVDNVIEHDFDEAKSESIDVHLSRAGGWNGYTKGMYR
jgi:hypothetical protein